MYKYKYNKYKNKMLGAGLVNKTIYPKNIPKILPNISYKNYFENFREYTKSIPKHINNL